MAQGAFKDEVEALFCELCTELCSESWFSGSAMIASTSTSPCVSCSHVGSGSGSGSAAAVMPELQWVEDPFGQHDIPPVDAAEAGANVRVISKVLAASRIEITTCQQNRTRFVRVASIWVYCELPRLHQERFRDHAYVMEFSEHAV